MTELDPTVNRMNIEAAENNAATLQEIVDDVGEDAEGERVEEVVDELHEKWTDRYGETAADLPEDTAEEIAEHLVAGDDVTVAPPPLPTKDVD